MVCNAACINIGLGQGIGCPKGHCLTRTQIGGRADASIKIATARDIGRNRIRACAGKVRGRFRHSHVEHRGRPGIGHNIAKGNGITRIQNRIRPGVDSRGFDGAKAGNRGQRRDGRCRCSRVAGVRQVRHRNASRGCGIGQNLVRDCASVNIGLRQGIGGAERHRGAKGQIERIGLPVQISPANRAHRDGQSAGSGKAGRLFGQNHIIQPRVAAVGHDISVGNPVARILTAIGVEIAIGRGFHDTHRRRSGHHDRFCQVIARIGRVSRICCWRSRNGVGQRDAALIGIYRAHKGQRARDAGRDGRNRPQTGGGHIGSRGHYTIARRSGQARRQQVGQADIARRSRPGIVDSDQECDGISGVYRRHAAHPKGLGGHQIGGVGISVGKGTGDVIARNQRRRRYAGAAARGNRGASCQSVGTGIGRGIVGR